MLLSIHLLVLLATGYCNCSYVRAATLPDADTRIVGGSVAPDGAFPYQIAMMNIKDEVYLFCGGSIIGKKWILTAAHCLKELGEYDITRSPESFVVGVGSNKLSSCGKSYKVESFIIHENYSHHGRSTDDIGLIKLTEEIEYTDKVQPIKVDDKYVDGGVKCTLTGWGCIDNNCTEPDDLRMLQVTVLSVTECKERLKVVKGAYYTDDEICTLDGRGKGTCQSDSGGPLVCMGTLRGLVSWNIPCGKGYPDVYTRLSSYIDWIRKNTGGEYFH